MELSPKGLTAKVNDAPAIQGRWLRPTVRACGLDSLAGVVVIDQRQPVRACRLVIRVVVPNMIGIEALQLHTDIPAPLNSLSIRVTQLVTLFNVYMRISP